MAGRSTSGSSGRPAPKRAAAPPSARGSAASRPPAKKAPAKKSAPKNTAPKKSAPRKPAAKAGTGRSDRQALGKVDGPRGQRDGRGADARRRRARTRRRLAGLAVSTVLVVGVLFAAGFPLRTYLTQRASTRKAEAQLREVQAERKAADDERKKLDTPEGVEKRARDLGYVKPGEQSYEILPGRTDPIGLPPGWPFTGVEEIIRGR